MPNKVLISFLCTIGKKENYKKEYGNPLCTITDEQINKGNITLVSAFADTLKGTMIFCKKCNIKVESYYTQEQYMKTGEEAIYSYCLIKDVMLPKFIAFIFEDNNQNFIPGDKTIGLVEPIIKFKEKTYILTGGICSPSIIYFTSFLYNYKNDDF